MDDLQDILTNHSIFPSEPLAEDLIIRHDQGDDSSGNIKIARCGSGTVVEWVHGKTLWLLTSRVWKCITFALVTCERGLLLPMALTSEEKIDKDLRSLRAWWLENRDSFTSGSLFAIMPDFEEYGDANAKAHSVLPEVERLTGMQAKATDFHKWTGKKCAIAAVYSDGTGIMPAVFCNDEALNPAAPPVEGNSEPWGGEVVIR